MVQLLSPVGVRRGEMSTYVVHYDCGTRCMHEAAPAAGIWGIVSKTRWKELYVYIARATWR